MQLVANQQLVKNRVRLGLGFHIGALAVFALGLVLSMQIDVARELPLASWVPIVRQDSGQVACVRDRWQTRSGPRLLSWLGASSGNPLVEATRQLQKLRK